jgi:hypothetical protein
LIHPLISTLLPASFLIPVSGIVSVLTGGRLPALRTAVVVCLGTGFLASLFENIARVERVRTPGRFRFSIVLIAVCYFGVSIFRPGSLRDRLMPSLENVWFALTAGVQWLLTTSFQETFRAREFLLEETEGKSGTALTLAIRDSATLTGAALTGLAMIRYSAVLFTVMLAALFITVDAFSLELGTGISFFALLCFLFLPLIAALTHQYAAEHDAACEGFPIDEQLRSRRLRAALLIIAFPLALTPFVCGTSPPLTPRLLLKFLSWLAGLFAFKSVPFDFFPKTDPGQIRLVEELMRMREAEGGSSGLDLSRLFDILKRILFVAAPIALIGFIAAPLFSHDFRNAIRKRSLLGFLLRKLRELASLFRFMSHKKEARVRVGYDDMEPIREALAALTKARRTGKKRREVGRMTKSFMELISWGAERSVPYIRSSAPGEYSRSLIPIAPHFEVEFLIAGDFFEEALYSDHLLEPERIATYERAIARITSPENETP